MNKQKIVYLDVDGTLMEFNWPKLGIENPRWKPVIRRLIIQGWKIIINTARVHDTEYGSMEAAEIWLREKFPEYTFEFTESKIEPEPWNPQPYSTVLYIDDIAYNTPLLKDSRKRPLVHWSDVRRDLETANLI